ncbi:MAG: hypothetical protein ISS82_01335 [Nanoarchaeota archaeon]|nr:hypothetical protein [Nanoarchaeota archaeon]
MDLVDITNKDDALKYVKEKEDFEFLRSMYNLKIISNHKNINTIFDIIYLNFNKLMDLLHERTIDFKTYKHVERKMKNLIIAEKIVDIISGDCKCMEAKSSSEEDYRNRSIVL